MTKCSSLLSTIKCGLEPQIWDALISVPATTFAKEYLGETSSGRHLHSIDEDFPFCNVLVFFAEKTLCFATLQERTLEDDENEDDDNLIESNKSLIIDANAQKRWMASDASDECMCCKKAFGILRRRHHCRSCGQLVCGGCSSLNAQQTGVALALRVCDSCLFASSPQEGQQPGDNKSYAGSKSVRTTVKGDSSSIAVSHVTTTNARSTGDKPSVEELHRRVCKERQVWSEMKAEYRSSFLRFSVTRTPKRCDFTSSTSACQALLSASLCLSSTATPRKAPMPVLPWCLICPGASRWLQTVSTLRLWCQSCND